ncbi:hypothetical protein [Vibrio cholerae]|jgi:hypothetical protein|uniref:hypothetical protein n=1 Tax=Vibrio cholerae TaxID=666 RepID=UPI0019114B0B|nr:hypothetical protein [Vibrio cholerae]MCE7626315.1 hypothetical protein [Vibrio fluvialis]
MHHQTYAFIHQCMLPYTKKGKKSTYKKKQMKRLIAIIDDIFQHEGMAKLDTIGKRQLIGYWRRTEHEKFETRRAKYTILKKFFALYHPQVTVPEPKKCAITSSLEF